MSEQQIYALRVNSQQDPDTNKWPPIVYKSLQDGVGRFGWSYIKTANLLDLKTKVELNGFNSLSEDEKWCYQGFLLTLKKGDWVIYINTPEYKKCTIAQVSSGYFWPSDEKQDDDFNHSFVIDTSTIKTFDRDDAIVPGNLKARLVLPPRKWRIFEVTEFLEFVTELSLPYISRPRTLATAISRLNNDIKPMLVEITQKIQKNHPNYDLEEFVCAVLKNIPSVKNVIHQGGAGDNGADIIFTYESGLPLAGMQVQETCVVQVKSFIDKHSDTKAVADIERAFARYPDAVVGLIISTASESTENFENAIIDLQRRSGKRVNLMIGSDVARFFLKYGAPQDP